MARRARVEQVAGPSIQTFGKYQILERIATGGMAEIYKARLEGIGGFQRTFAIKRILPNLSQNAEYIAMLVDEAKVAGLLSHANIVQILDLGQVDGLWYIAMEYVHGRDLGAVLRRAREKGLWLPVPHAVFIAIELLKGLEYAHQRQVMRGGRPVALNIIHRDISPPNILLSYQGEVKLTDFGIARANLRAMETVSGLVKGRFDYMSPEQAAGARDLDQRSDLFSVGVVLYEALTGTHPFRAEHEIQTVERVRKGQYTPVSQRNPEVPFALETIVDRALRVNRDERYPSATAFKEALDKFFHDAGFLFTHATLASYIKGLFPEASNRASATPAPVRRGVPTPTPVGADRETTTQRVRRDKAGRKILPDNLTDELQPDDHPTNFLDRRSVFGSATPPAFGMRADQEPTAIQRSPFLDADLDEDDDQETLIRQAPGWDEPSSTAVELDLDADETGQETVIRRSPLLDDDDLEEEPRPRSHGSPRPRTTTGRNKRRRARKPIGWLGGALAAVSLVVGLVLGSTLAVTLGLLAGFRPHAPVSGNEPAIRVVAPGGTQIRLNGDAVGSEVRVQPGVEHELEIHLRNHEPWVDKVTLQPGEERVFVIEVTPVRQASP